MHACRVADEFGIGTVIVPWAAGVASAVGMVHADAGAERRQPFVADLDEIDPAAFADVRVRLELDARAELDGDVADVADPTVTVQTLVGMSVRNQVHTLDVPLLDGALADALAALPDAFADALPSRVRRASDRDLQLRVGARPRRPRPTGTDSGASSPATPPATSSGRADGQARRPLRRPRRFRDHAGVPWRDLAPGARIAGPAVVQAADTTVVVPPERVATVDARRNLIVER